MRPLPALLSQLLVACTVEFDNTFEKRMRDAGHMGYLSLAFWLGYGRFVDPDAMPVGQFGAATSLSTRNTDYLLGVLERWGYFNIGPAGAPQDWIRPGYGTTQPIDPTFRLVPTARTRRALDIWPSIPAEIEARWVARFGEPAISALRRELESVIQTCEQGLPWGLPDCAMRWSLGRLPPPEAPLKRATAHAPLAALLSQVLWRFATEYNRESSIPIAIGASLLRVLDADGIQVAELPARTGVSGFSFDGSLRASGLFETTSVNRRRFVRLTPYGLAEKDAYTDLVREVEARWRADTLKNALLDLLDREELIAAGMEPPPGVPRSGDATPELWVNGPGSVRKSARALVKQTDAFIDDPAGALPHYPIWSGGRGFGP